MIKNIFARVWALWGLLTFIITFIFIFPFSMISNLMEFKKGQVYFIAVSKIWMSFWLFLIACRLKVTGTENFKKGENYIVLFNHNAFLDVPLSAPFVPGANKTIAKDSFARFPIFGWFYKRGAVLVNRKDDKSRTKSFEKMMNILKQGVHMCIYPEGTRNRTSAPLKPFYDGAFRLAKSSQKKIIPCIIKGTKKAMPIHKSFYLLPTILSMTFLPAVDVHDLSVEDLKNKVYQQMLEKYTQS